MQKTANFIVSDSFPSLLTPDRCGLIQADELSGLLGIRSHTHNTSLGMGQSNRHSVWEANGQTKAESAIENHSAVCSDGATYMRSASGILSHLMLESEEGKETIAGNMRGFAYIMRSEGAHKTMHINLSGKDFSCRRNFRWRWRCRNLNLAKYLPNNLSTTKTILRGFWITSRACLR